jgi:queuine tRNA-ribosyltransferase
MNKKQIKIQVSGLAPVFTTEAGSCLTLANWQEVGIKAGVYYLDALLMKPGVACLKKLSPLPYYTGWQGITVLNATSLPTIKNGVYTIRSRYDGSHIVIDQNELLSLMSVLQPDGIVLPDSIFHSANLRSWQILAKTSMLFAPVNDLAAIYPDWLLGRYVYYDAARSFSDFILQIRQYTNVPLYVAGEFECEHLQELASHHIGYVESNKPAADAVCGRVYGEEGEIDLLDCLQAEQHRPIIAGCNCPTCQQSLTRAYLHHLLVQTPLLCQRFLIQHNVHYYQQQLLGFNSERYKCRL